MCVVFGNHKSYIPFKVEFDFFLRSTPRAIKMCVVFEIITKKNYIPFKVECSSSSTPRAIKMCVVFEMITKKNYIPFKVFFYLNAKSYQNVCSI